MPLTDQLKDKESHIYQFLKNLFPNTRPFLADARKEVRATDTIVPAKDVPWGLIGTALDYRIRYYFDVTPHNHLVAYKGAQKLTAALDGKVQAMVEAAVSARLAAALGGEAVCDDKPIPIKSVYQDFFDGLDNLLEQAPPINTRLEMAYEDALNQHCIVLAYMEEVSRIGPHPANPLVTDNFDDANALLTVAQSHWIDDLRELSWEFYDKWNPLLHLPHALNPKFDGSVDVGGADADLVVDGLLIDIKATKTPSIAIDWLRQLLGYMLLDYSDQYGISSIGLYLARQGMLVQWSLEGVLESLCPSYGITSIEELRSQFQDYRAWTPEEWFLYHKKRLKDIDSPPVPREYSGSMVLDSDYYRKAAARRTDGARWRMTCWSSYDDMAKRAGGA